MGWDCLAYKSYWLRNHFLLVARSDHTTGSRNVKPEVVSKVQKMAQYALFCLTMSPFKGELPVFARLSLVRPPWRAPRRRLILAGPVSVIVSFTTGAVRSAILATAGVCIITADGLRQNKVAGSTLPKPSIGLGLL